MALLNPYLQFPATAREAMECYRDIFGGDLAVSTFGDFGATGEGAPPADGVMHARLVTDLGFTLMASDLPPGWPTPEGPGNIVVSISGDEGETIRGYFAALAEGGTVALPLEKQVWGDEFGQCTDRFGISWMVNVSEQAAG